MLRVTFDYSTYYGGPVLRVENIDGTRYEIIYRDNQIVYRKDENNGEGMKVVWTK